jgi:hypothetical protein
MANHTVLHLLRTTAGRVASLVAIVVAAGLAAPAAQAATDAPMQALAAAAECNAPDDRGIQRCHVGLDKQHMAQLLRTQKESQWCWAASIAMVFASEGFDVEQETVVKQNFGELDNEAARASEITNLLNRKWRDNAGRAFVASADATEFAGDLRRATARILSELANGRPLILGARRHAVVLAQVEFERFTREGAIRIVGGTVIDPWPGRGVRRMASYEMKPFYVARVRVETEAQAAAHPQTEPATVAGDSSMRVAGLAAR